MPQILQQFCQSCPILFLGSRGSLNQNYVALNCQKITFNCDVQTCAGLTDEPTSGFCRSGLDP